MSKKNPKVLVLATSRKTRGGITSVVKVHEAGDQWEKYHCKWLETHIDRGVISKLYYFFKSFSVYVFQLYFYDLVHIHISEPSSAIRKVPFIWCAKLLKKKIIVHFHSFSPDTTIKSKYREIYHHLFIKADLVLVLSEYWKNEINYIFQLKGKVEVLYNPCSEPDYTIGYKKQKYILYAGTLNKRKGYSDLIKAFALIAERCPKWKIIFAGNGEIQEGEELSLELGIKKQTVFLGWVTDNLKSKAFQEASIFCLPSYAEGFPMAVLDAWSYGLPVITTPVGGLTDILKNNVNALVFKPGDFETLAILLEKIIENDQMRNEISIESNKLAQSMFSKAAVNKSLDLIYERLLTYQNSKQ